MNRTAMERRTAMEKRIAMERHTAMERCTAMERRTAKNTRLGNAEAAWPFLIMLNETLIIILHNHRIIGISVADI